MPQDENKTSANAEALADKQEEPEISEELKGEEISGEQEAAPAEPAVEPIPEIPEPAKSAEQPTQTEQTETPAPAEQKREETPAVEPPVEQMPPESPAPVDANLAAEPPSEIAEPLPTQQQPQVIEKIIYQTPPNFIQNLLIKARAKIQERKRKKLDKIMLLFELNSEISNSNIQNLLRTTKRSANRYLNILEKEGKITQVGKTGRGVKYVRI